MIKMYDDNASVILLLNNEFTMSFAAGQERFRTLTSSYYRGAHGIILGKRWMNQESLMSFTWLRILRCSVIEMGNGLIFFHQSGMHLIRPNYKCISSGFFLHTTLHVSPSLIPTYDTRYYITVNHSYDPFWKLALLSWSKCKFWLRKFPFSSHLKEKDSFLQYTPSILLICYISFVFLQILLFSIFLCRKSLAFDVSPIQSVNFSL